jgi:hypothetical protein
MKFIIVLLSVLTALTAQTYSTFHDAKTLAMAGATSSLSDVRLAAFSNPASLAELQKRFVFVNASAPYSEFDIFKVGALTGAMPVLNYGVAAFSAEFFQVKYGERVLQSENSYVLSHGFDLLRDVSTSLSFGYNLRMHQLIYNNFAGTGNSQETFNMMIDIGARATIYKRIFLGAFVKNLTNTKIGQEEDQELLREFQIGIGYMPYEGMVTTLDLSKELGYISRYHFGVEYAVYSTDKLNFDLRFGVVSQPNQVAFGFGVKYDDFTFDYGALSHPIGLTHQFGLAYVIR